MERKETEDRSRIEIRDRSRYISGRKRPADMRKDEREEEETSWVECGVEKSHYRLNEDAGLANSIMINFACNHDIFDTVHEYCNL